MRVGVEIEYSVIAEPRSEDEDVICYTTLHCVVARSTIQNIGAFASRENVVAFTAIENVLPVAASDRVLLDSSGQRLATIAANYGVPHDISDVDRQRLAVIQG